MIGIFQGSPEGRANECQRRAKGGLPRATSKKQGKRRAWEGALPKAGQFGSCGSIISECSRSVILYVVDLSISITYKVTSTKIKISRLLV